MAKWKKFSISKKNKAANFVKGFLFLVPRFNLGTRRKELPKTNRRDPVKSSLIRDP